MIKNWEWRFIERPKRIIHSFVFYKLLRWDNAKSIQHEVNKHRNELVYESPFDVVRLLGWTDQYDDDYCWVIYERKRGVCLSSCVGGFIWLKDYLPLWEYHYADEIFEINEPIENAMAAIKERGIVLR